MIARLAVCAALTALFATSPGCGSDALGDCPPNSQNQQTSGSQIVFFTCIGCHSSQLEGAAREGAPPGTDYDIIENVRRDAVPMYEETRDGLMPPGSPLSERQIEDLRVFLACGANTDQN